MVNFTETDLTQVAVKSKLELDTIRILAITETCEVTTIRKEVDVNGEVVNQENGPNFIYKNRQATETEPATTEYNDLMQKLGLTKSKIRTAVKEMES